MGYDMNWRRKAQGEDEAVAAAQEAFHAAVTVRDSLPSGEAGTYDFEVARDRKLSMDDPAAYPGQTKRYQQAQEAVDAAYEELYTSRSSYFRANVWGMGTLRGIMMETGMAFEDTPHPPFPSVSDLGIEWDHVYAIREPGNSYYDDIRATMTNGQREQAQRFAEESDQVRSFHGKADTPGIPIHKFCSNDGWIVLPAECLAAAKIWDDWRGKVGEEAAHNFIVNRVDSDGDAYAWWLRWVKWLRDAAQHDGFEVY